MKTRICHTSRPRSNFLSVLTLVLIAGALLWPTHAGIALAQTVPGGTPPTSPIADGAPPIPDQATPVTEDAPLTTSVNTSTGMSLSVSLPGVIGEQPVEATLSIAPATLQNLTDGNGNPVGADRLVSAPASPSAAANLPPLPPGGVGISTIVKFDLIDPDGNVIDHPNFNPPLVLGFTPSPEMIASAGGIENVKVMVIDSLTGQWAALPVSVIDGKIYASVTHFSYFQMVAAVSDATPARLPSTGAADGLTLVLLQAIAVGAILFGATLVGRRLWRQQR